VTRLIDSINLDVDSRFFEHRFNDVIIKRVCGNTLCTRTPVRREYLDFSRRRRSNRGYNNIGESALLKFISIHVAQNFRTEIVSRALNYLTRETYKAFFAN